MVTQLGRNDGRVWCTHYLCGFCAPHCTQMIFTKVLELKLFYLSRNPVTLEMKKEGTEWVKN